MLEMLIELQPIIREIIRWGEIVTMVIAAIFISILIFIKFKSNKK